MANSYVPLLRKLPSTRQREVLKLIAEGHSLKEIAYRLRITYSAAAQHRVRLMEKLHVHNIEGLIRYALEHPHEIQAIEYPYETQKVSVAGGT